MVLVVSLMAFISGIVVFFVAPFLAKFVENLINAVPKTADSNLSERAVGKYREMGVLTIAKDGLLIVKRSTGGFTWVGVKREGDELVGTLSGDEKRWIDPEGNSGRLYGKLFGIAHEDHNVLLSPSDVSVMERYIQKKSKNEEVIDVESTDPEGGPKRARYAWTGFPKSGSRYVNVDLFADVARGNCSPRVSSRIEEFVKKMFMGYNDSAVFEKLMILLAFAVGLGAVAFVWYVAQSVGGGGGGSPVPIFVGPGGLL